MSLLTKAERSAAMLGWLLTGCHASTASRTTVYCSALGGNCGSITLMIEKWQVDKHARMKVGLVGLGRV